jgi:hypothetical protein
MHSVQVTLQAPLPLLLLLLSLLLRSLLLTARQQAAGTYHRAWAARPAAPSSSPSCRQRLVDICVARLGRHLRLQLLQAVRQARHVRADLLQQHVAVLAPALQVAQQSGCSQMLGLC